MTGTLTVRPGEKGVVRVFALNMAPEQARFLKEPGAAAQVLGVPDLDQTQVDVFPVSDLEELGLDGYLIEGCGIPESQIAGDRTNLSAQHGWVMVVRSRAFGGQSLTLAPKSALNLIGTYCETGPDWRAEPMAGDSALPRRGGRMSPRAARAQTRRIGASIFAVVMLIVAFIVYLMVT